MLRCLTVTKLFLRIEGHISGGANGKNTPGAQNLGLDLGIKLESLLSTKTDMSLCDKYFKNFALVSLFTHTNIDDSSFSSFAVFPVLDLPT